MNLESFKTTIKSNPDILFVIDFTAQWCGPCKSISPKIDELEKIYNVNNQQLLCVIKVDVDENEDIVSEFNISSMPTFVFIKNSSVVGTTCGANIDAVNEIIKKNLYL
jgi:thioredoxin 1